MSFDMVVPEIRLLQFETNTACNADCRFCERRNMTRKAYMKTSQIVDLLYRFAHKSSQICPFGMQEPTLEPRLSMILANCKQLNPNAATFVYSNLTRFDEQTWTEIIKWGTLDYLMVSYYAPDKKTYNILQPGLDYEEVAGNIKKIVKLREKLRFPKPRINLMYLVTPETVGKDKPFRKRWNGVVDAIGAIHFDSWRGLQPYNLEWEQSVWNDYMNERWPCSRLWSILLIHANGNVVPCCLDHNEEALLGNVFREPDLFWNSKQLNKLRQLHVERRFNEIPLCRDCMFWRYGENKEWIEFWKQRLYVPSVVNP